MAMKTVLWTKADRCVKSAAETFETRATITDVVALKDIESDLKDALAA